MVAGGVLRPPVPTVDHITAVGTDFSFIVVRVNFPAAPLRLRKVLREGPFVRPLGVRPKGRASPRVGV